MLETTKKKGKNASGAPRVDWSTINRVLPVNIARGAGKRAAGHRLTPSGGRASSL